MAPPPRNPAELLGGVLEQRLNRIGTAAIEDAEVPPRRTGPVQPDILSAEDVDRVFGTDGALALAPLGQPEIGVRMVELEGDMHRLKLGIGRSIAGTVCRIAGGARLRLQRSRRFAGICAATERDNETFQHRGRYEGGKNGTFFRLRDKRLVSSLTSYAGREDVFLLVHEKTCPHHVRLCPPST
jgi:hypothetical protein